MKHYYYWKPRTAIDRLLAAEKIGEEYSNKIQAIYSRANRNIKRDIENIYINYAKDTGLDVQTLRTLLTKKETDKFFKTLKGKGLQQYVKNNYKSRISRFEQLQGQIYAKAKEIYQDEYNLSTRAYKHTLKNSYNRVIYDVQMQTGFGFSFKKLDDRLINQMLDIKLVGKNYSERIWANTDILANELTEILGGGLVGGQSHAKTSKQILDASLSKIQSLAKTEQEIREAFKKAKYYADRLVRTETNYFHSEAQAKAYEEMGIDEYIFIAVLDNKTSAMCQELDGKIFKVKDRAVGKNCNPMHPNCRSTTDAYLGKEYEPTQRLARNPKTNENELVDNVPYNEWLKKYG